ncbi:hypothetical protein [Burkholderia gladioli]|uniref:hypothetical protein n=1 Tax=Burkholderia gladioli TaxID=28095 RepID=UPI00163FE433|nr:hypothetical protein [Burkholderia gladioli]
MNQQEDRKLALDHNKASVAGSGLQGPRRDPTQVSYFTPYMIGDVVPLGGQDWQVKHDTPGWYLTNTGTWEGMHPTIRHISSMNDLISLIEQAFQSAQPSGKPSETKTRPTIATRFSDHTGIFFRYFSPGNSKPFWQHVDMNDSRDAQVGPHYNSKDELLSDHESYLRRAGWLVEDSKQEESAACIRMGWHQGVSTENVNFVGLYLTTQAAIDADEGPDDGDLVQSESTVAPDLFERVCAAVNERDPKSQSDAIQFALATLDGLAVDTDALRLRERLEAALAARKVRSVPTEEESAALKVRFKDHFAKHGIDSALPPDLAAAKLGNPVEWDEACREFDEYGWSTGSASHQAGELAEVPNEGEFQSFRYDDETESGFIIRNEGDGRFKAEDWRDGDIVDNAYGTYEEMKAWTEVEAARKDLALLVRLDAAGVEPVFRRDLAGYAGQAAAKELVENWDDALRNDSNGKIVGNLIGDVDETIAALSAFRARASAVLPARYQPVALRQTPESLESQPALTEERVFEVARRHGIQSYLIHDRQLIAFLESLLGQSLLKAAASLEKPEQKSSSTPGV